MLHKSYTPYSKMAAILVFFCLIANWPFWPRSRLHILWNFTFESEAKRVNLQGAKEYQNGGHFEIRFISSELCAFRLSIVLCNLSVFLLL